MTSGHSPLAIRLIAMRRQHTITLEGEIDLAGVPELDAVIAGVCAGEPRTITLDLRKVTFIDSTGVHSLFAANEACRQHGHELQIIPGPANIQRVFEMTGITDSLPFTNTDNASSASAAAQPQSYHRPLGARVSNAS